LKQTRTRIKARIQVKKEYPQQPKKEHTDSPRHSERKKSYAQRAVAMNYPEDTDSYEDSTVEQVNIVESKVRSVFGGMTRTSDVESIRCHVEVSSSLQKKR
jgi:hypothetical protein